VRLFAKTVTGANCKEVAGTKEGGGGEGVATVSGSPVLCHPSLSKVTVQSNKSNNAYQSYCAKGWFLCMKVHVLRVSPLPFLE